MHSLCLAMMYKQKIIMLAALCSVFFVVVSRARAAEMTREEAQAFLGVSANDPLAFIRSRRNALLREFHTDLGGDRASTAMAQKANQAYAVLEEGRNADLSTERRRSSNREYFSGDEIYWDHVFFELGFNPATLLKDFSYEEMLMRTGTYERFYAEFSASIAQILLAKRNPYFLDLKGFWQKQRYLIKHHHLAIKLALFFSILNQFYDFNFHSAIAGIGGVVAYQSFATWQAYAPAKALVNAINRGLGVLIEEMNDSGDDDRKTAIVAFDLVEIIFNLQIPAAYNSTPEFIYSRLEKLMRAFPQAREGLELRAEAGVGLAGRLKERFAADHRAWPRRNGPKQRDGDPSSPPAVPAPAKNAVLAVLSCSQIFRSEPENEAATND